MSLRDHTGVRQESAARESSRVLLQGLSGVCAFLGKRERDLGCSRRIGGYPGNAQGRDIQPRRGLVGLPAAHREGHDSLVRRLLQDADRQHAGEFQDLFRRTAARLPGERRRCRIRLAPFDPTSIHRAQSATPKPKSAGMWTTVWWVISTIGKARVNGDYKHTPFFRMDTGKAIAEPHVLSVDERATAMRQPAH